MLRTRTNFNMRGIGSWTSTFFIYVYGSYKPPEHSPFGSLFQCCLKKKTKNTRPYFLNSPRISGMSESFEHNFFKILGLIMYFD